MNQPIKTIAKRTRWELLATGVVMVMLGLYINKTKDEGTPTEKASIAIAQVDTTLHVLDTVAAVVDTVKVENDSQGIYIRKNTAQLEEITKWIKRYDREAAMEIKKAADTVEPEPQKEPL